MVTFHTLIVREVQPLTKEAVAIQFEVPDALKELFVYKQGQHLTLKTTINGEEVRRSYSVSSCPLDEPLTVAIKQVPGGKFSTYANTVLQAGDKLEVMAPTGHFYRPLDQANDHLYVAFASGSGITPILSIVKTTLLTEPKSSFILFYGNRTMDSIMYKEKLEGLKNEFMGRLSLHHILSQERQESDLFSGRIDKEKIERFAHIYFHPLEVADFFTCGPEQMMRTVKETLGELGVAEKQIHMELFTSPLGKLDGERKQVKRVKAQSQIVILQDGNRFEFPYNSDLNILDAAFEKGADLPFACKGGVCSTCAAKVLEGEVKMAVNYALAPDELDAGLVLTCQSYPTSDRVVISFDE